MMEKTLRRLLDGEYICTYRFKEEYNDLQSEACREEVNAWLDKLDMRLAQLGDDGAYFMASNFIGVDEIGRVREEMRRFRDVYGPAVTMLDFVRQSCSDTMSLAPGDYLQLADLELTVTGSASLEEHLKGISAYVKSYSPRNSVRENLRRLVEHLKDDGYIMLVNSSTDSYQMTGKVDQLHAVISFISENEKILTELIPDDTQDLLQGAAHE